METGTEFHSLGASDAIKGSTTHGFQFPKEVPTARYNQPFEKQL